MPERLYIVDGHGYIFRAHYGLMNISRGERKEVRLSTSEGMPTGALYVFTRMLMRLEEDNAPKRMAVVFDDKSGRADVPRRDVRRRTRRPARSRPRSSQVQMEYFPKIVEAIGWPVLAVPGRRGRRRDRDARRSEARAQAAGRSSSTAPTRTSCRWSARA